MGCQAISLLSAAHTGAAHSPVRFLDRREQVDGRLRCGSSDRFGHESLAIPSDQSHADCPGPARRLRRCASAVGEAARAVSCQGSVGLTRSSWLPPPQKALSCQPHRRCLAPSSLAGFTACVLICPSGWSRNWSAGIKSETSDGSDGAPDDGRSGSGSSCAVHSPVRPLLGVGGSMGGFAADPAIHPVARASRHIRGRKAGVIGYVDGFNLGTL